MLGLQVNIVYYNGAFMRNNSDNLADFALVLSGYDFYGVSEFNMHLV